MCIVVIIIIIKFINSRNRCQLIELLICVRCSMQWLHYLDQSHQVMRNHSSQASVPLQPTPRLHSHQSCQCPIRLCSTARGISQRDQRRTTILVFRKLRTLSLAGTFWAACLGLVVTWMLAQLVLHFSRVHRPHLLDPLHLVPSTDLHLHGHVARHLVWSV